MKKTDLCLALSGAAALILLLVLLGGALSLKEGSLPFDNESVQELSDGWHMANGAPVGKLPQRLEAAAGAPVSLTRTLPADMKGPVVLCFRSVMQQVRVLFQGEELYAFGFEDNRPFSKSPGSVWNLVRLPEGCAGGVVTLELTSPYRMYAGLFGATHAGTKASLLFHLLRSYLPALLATALISLAGMVLCAMYCVFGRRYGSGRSMLYLGLFVMAAALWMAGETRLIQFFIGNPLFSMSLTFGCMLLFPVPLMLFIGCTQDFRYKGLCKGLAALLCVNAGIVFALQALNVWDFIEMLPGMQIVLGVCCLTALAALLADAMRNRNIQSLPVLFALVAFTGFGILEIWASYQTSGANPGDFMRLGVLTFIGVYVALASRWAVQIMRLSREATMDALTGCRNRTAYLQHLDRLAGRRGVVAVMADLNDLKWINDTLGHEMGDQALIRAARCFCSVLDSYGVCYRIGGDEFLFLGEGMEEGRLSALLADFKAVCAQEQERVCFPLRVAAGGAEFDAALDSAVSDTIRRADQSMYAVKREMKCTLTDLSMREERSC